jgi:pyruvate formate-lyase/glycerol dehydratase family glycyl radical enzyme
MARAAVEKVGIGGNGRVSKLRQKVLCPPEVCIERGYLITESYRQTESEPPVIRRAKALEKVLKEMTISIDDDELIVGRATSKQRGGPLLPEVQWEWYLEEMDLLSTREWDRLAPLTEEEKTKMREFLPYWKGESLYEKWRVLIPEDVLELHHVIEEGGAYCANGTHFAHISPDYGMVVSKGLSYVKKHVDEEIEKLDLADIKDFNKLQFLRAVNITLEAAIHFAKRYAELARNLAKREADVHRKAELERIAETCAWVPANPARSFYEALQSVWFIYAVLMIEGWGNGIGFGRPDQYLYPIYKKDIAEGKLTREEARDLISLLYIKMNGVLILQASQAVKTFCGFATWANVTLGGLTKDGRDAVNELSYLFLDAEEEVRLSAEDIIIRVHNNTPDAFLMRACETLKTLRGKFKFVSDETTIQQLLSDGKPVDYARDYTICGCNCPTVPAYSHDLPGPIMNLPLMLGLALNNGVSRLTGKQIGPKTGDPRKFKSYEEVWDAYKKQVEALIPVALILKNVDKQIFAQFAPTPFQSALFHGCIEKGLDITNGGTSPYMTRAISLGGAPNVGDSLAAIKKAVFEDKKFSMSRLIDALDKNFEGEGEILHILKSAPKFGNDDDYVDSIVNEVLIHGSNVAAKNKGGVPGALSTVAAAIVTANVPLGQIVGALPDGRRAGEPLSEGGISPYQGRNVSGPTATMRSVAKLDHIKLTNGSVLNIRFNPDVLKGESKTRKFASLIRTFCETGGALVQFNIVGGDTLRDAQIHPEKYRDLLVRVATYSAYFVELSKELQDDIIARTEFQEA